MGYFANGTEGEIYESMYCDKCVHQNGCSVWWLHLDWNYEAIKEPTKNYALDALMPRSDDGLSNLKCTMFYERKKE